jgi:cytochrome P450
MSTPVVDTAAKVLTDPIAYTDEARLHAALTHLRAHAPVSLVDSPPYRPFWAITKHADIVQIERAHTMFINAPRTVLATADEDDLGRAQLEAGMGVRTLVHMDDPDHRAFRAIGADWFRPTAMRALKARIDELARIHVDKMAAAGGECDFVQEVAVNYPLYVILSLLGLPESDFARILTLTHELFGVSDPERQRGSTPEKQFEVVLELFEYFTALTTSRREQPTEDLASAIANARIDGKPLSDMDTMSYYMLIATAGHDTTTSTIAGGLRALIENPDQRRRLTDDLELMPLATEEIIRWATPVKGFMRTAAADTAVRGVAIGKGESLYLSYVSANRDEEVFDDPFRFDVGRNPNRHSAFGHGVHFCLGAALARMEVHGLFAELLPRLKSIELNGEPELIATTIVGGLKRLPIRYSLR